MNLTNKLVLVIILLNLPALNSFGQAELISERQIQEFPKDSSLIKKNFTILESQLAHMGSIDWNSSFECYDMVLKSDSFPDNIRIKFKTRRLFSPGIRPLRTDLSKIKNTLYKSYPIKFANTHDSTRIDIHYVNRKSLSKYAVKDLKADMKELNISTKLPNFKDAILITLLYGQTYQRWIVLNNGKSFLWHYKGDTVLDLNTKDLNLGVIYSYGHSFKIIDTDGKIEK